jgi:hypothetical protein
VGDPADDELDAVADIVGRVCGEVSTLVRPTATSVHSDWVLGKYR